jgi:hypothetical protein
MCKSTSWPMHVGVPSDAGRGADPIASRCRGVQAPPRSTAGRIASLGWGCCPGVQIGIPANAAAVANVCGSPCERVKGDPRSIAIEPAFIGRPGRRAVHVGPMEGAGRPDEPCGLTFTRSQSEVGNSAVWRAMVRSAGCASQQFGEHDLAWRGAPVRLSRSGGPRCAAQRRAVPSARRLGPVFEGVRTGIAEDAPESAQAFESRCTPSLGHS